MSPESEGRRAAGKAPPGASKGRFRVRARRSVTSDINWSVKDGKLLGGLTNIKGMGASKAADVVRRRESGIGYQPGQAKLLAMPRTPFDDIFEAERRYGDWYRNPKAHNVLSGRLTYISDIGSEPGEYIFIGRLMEKNLRDLNEYQSVVKRGGRTIQGNSQFLNMIVEDDTGSIIVKIERSLYASLGKPLVEEGSARGVVFVEGNYQERRLADSASKTLAKVADGRFGPGAGEG
jgi:hypothetical protein